MRTSPHRSGVDADTVNTLLEGQQRQPVVEVDVRHHRERCAGHYPPQGLSRLSVRNGDAYDVASRRLQLSYLEQGGFDVGGVGIGHGLHAHRCASPYRNSPKRYTPGLFSECHASLTAQTGLIMD